MALHPKPLYEEKELVADAYIVGSTSATDMEFEPTKGFVSPVGSFIRQNLVLAF